MLFDRFKTIVILLFLLARNIHSFQTQLKSKFSFLREIRYSTLRNASRRDSGNFDDRQKSKSTNVNPTKKGFGATSKPTSATESNKTTKESLEINIQNSIGKIPGLQEYMDLKDDVNAWKISHTTAGQSIPQAISDKMGKLDILTQQGFTGSRTSILNQITWDACADFRHQRHSTMVVSESSERFMLQVASWCLPNAASGTNHILDCGTGDGILVRFLKKAATETQKQSSLSSTFNLLGIDLSENMINIAKGMYTDHIFKHIGFLDYRPETMTPRFYPDVVVFNECLHYFDDTFEALRQANTLLTSTKGDGESNGKYATSRRVRIVVSHPKGFNNVILQRSVNHHLVPSLLPTKEEISHFAQQYEYETLVVPDTKANNYLFVLEKKI